MSNYVQTTFFTPKDTLPPTDPNKTIFGAAYDVEFGNIATAVSTKLEAGGSPTFVTLTATSVITTTMTASGSVSAGNLVLTGSAVPANGWYLPSANTLGVATNSVSRGTIGATGAWSLAAPTGGATTLSLGTAGSGTLVFNANPSNSGYSTFSGSLSVGSSSGDYPFVGYNVGATSTPNVYNYLGTDFASRIRFLTGGIVFQTAASGTAGNPITFGTAFTISQANGFFSSAATGGDQGSGTVNSTGLFINGNQLFFGAPASASTTAAVTDVGKVINAAGTIIIPNATFSQGHMVSIYNNTAGSIGITATITTMRLAGTATTGSRTLAARGLATIWFESGTECVVSGAGVT